MTERGDKTAADMGEAAGGTGLPVLPPLWAVAEIAVLFGLIYGLDRLVPSLAVLDMSPHPFWLPVLLVSLQYGTVSGFVAAIVATLLALGAGLPEQDIGENLFAYFLRVWGQPILWIAVALLVGQFRMRQLTAKHELREANRALLQQRDTLAHHAGELRSRIELLEQELSARFQASPHRTAAALAAAMAKGGLAAGGDRSEALMAASGAMFPDAVIVAYAIEDGRLVEAAVRGRRPDTGPRISIDASDPLHRAVIGERRSLSVLSRGDERILAGTALLATPIVDGSGDVYGMLAIESADAAVVTEDGLDALMLLAHALAPRPAVSRSNEGGSPAPAMEKVDASPTRAVAQQSGESKPLLGPRGSDRRRGLVQLLAGAELVRDARASSSEADEPMASQTEQRSGG